MAQNKPNIKIRTIHEAEICWWWAESHVHDSDYCNKVNNAVSDELKRLCEASETLYVDDHYCCQFEGVQVSGTCAREVNLAGYKLAKFLKRYKFVEFI